MSEDIKTESEDDTDTVESKQYFHTQKEFTEFMAGEETSYQKEIEYEGDKYVMIMQKVADRSEEHTSELQSR